MKASPMREFWRRHTLTQPRGPPPRNTKLPPQFASHPLSVGKSPQSLRLPYDLTGPGMNPTPVNPFQANTLTGTYASLRVRSPSLKKKLFSVRTSPRSAVRSPRSTALSLHVPSGTLRYLAVPCGTLRSPGSLLTHSTSAQSGFQQHRWCAVQQRPDHSCRISRGSNW
jgi:hypothetical protein